MSFLCILYQEIDYIKEGKNAERFRENFKNYPGILVPKIYWKYTTHKVLTMQYLPGIKADDRMRQQRLEI
jgi:Predicted unusual protein kinase